MPPLPVWLDQLLGKTKLISSDMKRVTIKDIANHLCLSVSTVSRALADDKNIRQETKERIYAAAEKLGYKRNQIAANLRCGRSNTIAVIVNEMVTPFASRLVAGAQNFCNERGIYLVTCNSDNSREIEEGIIDMISHSLIDGVVVVPCDKSNLLKYGDLRRKGYPLVFVMDSPEGMDVSSVVLNNYDKVFYLLDHLVCSGRRRIVVVTPSSVSLDDKSMVDAYSDTMKKFKMPFDRNLVIDGGTSVEDGIAAVDRLVENGVEFDAVLACNELVSIGVMNRLRDHGIRIPADVAVAGFTGSELANIVYPSLTTVDPPLEEMGYKAMELLFRHIEEPAAKPERIVMDAKIAYRNSTAIEKA